MTVTRWIVKTSELVWPDALSKFDPETEDEVVLAKDYDQAWAFADSNLTALNRARDQLAATVGALEAIVRESNTRYESGFRAEIVRIAGTAIAAARGH